MQYVGSKNRLSKELSPIIQSYIVEDTKGYLEPFVGGANMIDKIQCDTKIGIDLHEELIELLQYAHQNELPETISEEEYKMVKDNRDNYPKWYVGLVGFCGSFGAKYFGGFAKGNDTRNRPQEAIRNLKKQSEKAKFKDIQFIHMDFLDLPKEKIKNFVIYCDPPYRGTTKYKTGEFPYEEFYQWCRDMSGHNTVLVSEYNMPDDFRCIWEKELKTTLGSGVNGDNDKNRVERLFIHKSKKQMA